MNRVLRDFISLFYPRICLGCNRTLISQEDYLCLHCKLSLPHPLFDQTGENPLRKRLPTVNNLVAVFAYLQFNRLGVAQKLLHQVKYQNQEKLGIALGEWFGHHIKETATQQNIDIIIPIPLHKHKKKRRGYNQSELICKGLSQVLDLPTEPDILHRKVYTSTQTKKGKIDRWINVEDIFEVSDKDRIKDKHILLVDDVITTGATVESAANQLNDSGAKSISVGCIATGQK